MTSLRVRVRTPSRLHFGLLAWGAAAARQFGGVGLMIQAPGIELLAERSPDWIVEGPLAARVERIIHHLEERAREARMPVSRCRIEVKNDPPEHAGLGVGTQLSLAVARAVLLLGGAPDVATQELAQLMGRGFRSGIGLHGFEQGGLVVDGGRRRENDVPPLLTRLPFPEDWSIVVLRPQEGPGLHGLEERRAFDTLPPIAASVTEALCRLVLLEMLPAVVEHDLAAFGAALTAVQARVGACFAPAQGGIFLSARAASIVDELRNLGFAGLGQSSWGPTVYGFTERAGGELAALVERLRRHFDLAPSAVFTTTAANHGATLTVELE
jgi:beta-ribofuranosylaminobenzene 5'-phosphate synthase